MGISKILIAIVIVTVIAILAYLYINGYIPSFANK